MSFLRQGCCLSALSSAMSSVRSSGVALTDGSGRELGQVSFRSSTHAPTPHTPPSPRGEGCTLALGTWASTQNFHPENFANQGHADFELLCVGLAELRWNSDIKQATLSEVLVSLFRRLVLPPDVTE